MSDSLNRGFSLPPEQQAIRDRCVHPAGTFLEFSKEEVEQSISERFEKIVRMYPERIAVKTTHQAVTYSELDAMATRIARGLIARGGIDPELVGLSVDKGIPLVAAMLGVLKAGNFFVILDPSLPRPRMVSALTELRVKLLITAPTYLLTAENDDHCDCEVVELEAMSAAARGDHCQLTISPSATACLFYTAGSTGRPKVVIQSHRNLLHYQLLRAKTDGLKQDERYGHLASATSNAISHALFCVLNGATLALYDMKREGIHKLTAWLIAEGITICNMGAPLFRHFCSTLSGHEKFPMLRLLRLGSDTVYRSDVELHRVHFPATCRLAVGYSTSETGDS